MQVVYSGGTTPNPSPGRSRKSGGYGRPVLPGYMTHVHPQVTVQRSREDRPAEQDQSLRDYIPAMSTGLAALCLVLNLVLPGTGTMAAGVSLMCCSRARPAGSSRSHCMWVNIGVGAVQLFLTFIFLMGWIWSIMWGVAFISIAREYNLMDRENNKTQLNMINSPSVRLTSNTKETSSSSNHRAHHRKLLADALPEHSAPLTVTSNDTPASAHRTPHHPDHDAGSSANGDLCPEVTELHVTNIAQSVRQPIIALQQIPGGHLAQPEPAAPNEALMKAGTRKMKILKRKLSDNDLSPFVLTHQQLEAIVIHDLPVIASSGETEEEGSVLPKTL
uniref:Protein SPEC3 n=1 Tax=Biomphalaria glabrata TaxID=6526 RepID=A0A2C9L9H0_BIOGL